MKTAYGIALGLVAVFSLALAAMLAVCFWVMQAPAVPYALMEKMRVGMNEDEVRQLLGDPRSDYPDPDGSENWVYCRFTWAMYKVDFDANGTVVRLEHDF